LPSGRLPAIVAGDCNKPVTLRAPGDAPCQADTIEEDIHRRGATTRAGSPRSSITIVIRKDADVKATERRFSGDILADFRESKGLQIRAGTGRHRFIGIWVVVVNDRVFVRSWSVKPGGWYRTFLAEPRGVVHIAGREIAVRAARARDTRVRDAVDRAYLDKYHTPGAIKYARDLGSPKSRATTLELTPRVPIKRRS
jgi:hypothetical protein